MSAMLERRVRQVRSRAQTRRWEYRQRRHAQGTWCRLRRLLADAEGVYVIDAHDAARLVAEGVPLERPGLDLQPTKQIFVVSRERAAELVSATRIEVRLDERF